MRTTRGTRFGTTLAGLACLGAAVLAVVAPADVRAQTPAALAVSCVDGGGEVSLCLAGATAAHAIMGNATLLSAGGSPIPGTASNLGTRVGGGPRLSFHAQAAASSWGMPDATAPTEERSAMVTAFRLGAAAGLFDGFRLMPTVGGFLATDVFADLALLSTSGSDGFSGGIRSYGVGARIGLFREGFTMPGASVSLARRFFGDVAYGEIAGGDAVAASADPSLTSIRVTVSKDLFAVEVLGGFGWDDVSGDGVVRVPDGSGGTLASSGSIDDGRRLYFGSASMTFSLILTLTVEGGWAEGLGPVPGYSGAYDPTAGGAFGSFGARLVF